MRHRVPGVLLAILLIACLWNIAQASSDVETYYPLSPRTMTYEYYKNGVKDSATRQVAIQKARVVDGAEVIPTVMTGPDIKYPVTKFVQKGPDGVYMFGSQLSNGTIVKTSIKAPVLKNPIKEGTYFDSDVSFSNPGVVVMTSHLTFSVDRIDEVVTVPFGLFTKCIKTKSLIRMGNTTFEDTAWLAPKIGVVKRIEVKKSNDGETVTITRSSQEPRSP